MVHAIPQKPSPVLCSLTVSITYRFSALPTANGLAEKYVQIMKSLFYKAKGEDKDFYKCLMIYHSNLLTGIMKSPMQNLKGRNARADLPMPNAARKQLGIQPGSS